MKKLVFTVSLCLLQAMALHLFSQAPVIVQHPISGQKCAGDAVTLSVIASGELPLTYEWFFEAMPVGGNSPEFVIDPVNETHEGSFYCRVSNGHGSVESNIAQLLVVESAPIINSYSEAQNLCQGETLTLSSDVTAELASYTWFLDGFGQVHFGNTYVNSTISAALSGNYYCVVQNVCGSESTGMIAVSISDLPVLISQSESVEVCEGSDVTLTISATGSSLQYKWLADNVEIPGETNSELFIESVEYPNNIFYTPIVYNSCESITGNNIAISVLSVPHITAQPISQGDCDGEEISLYATAFSNIDVSYQWFNESGPLSGEESSMLSIITEEGLIETFYCIISNACASVSTDTAVITGFEAPFITQQPTDSVVCAGNNASFHCKANGEEPLYYQWLFNGAIMPFDNTFGVNTSTLEIDEVFTGQQGLFTCYVYNQCGSATTDEALLTVHTPPQILLQPESVGLCAGNELEIQIMVEGTDPISYQWINTATPGEVLGTDAQFVIPSLQQSDAGIYICNISNQCGDVVSETFTIDVFLSPEIYSENEDFFACEGDLVSFSVDATGTEPMYYLWYRNNSAETWANQADIVFDPAGFGHTGNYFCRVMNLCGETDSEEFFFHVGTPPSIEWHSGNQYLCELDSLLLTVDPAGENILCQWYRGDQEIPGATDTVLSIPVLSLNQAGAYLCKIYNACDEIYTDTMYVTVNPAPEVNLGPDREACQGDIIVLHPEGEYQSYNWNNGLNTTPYLEVASSGTYHIVVVGLNACRNYDTVQIQFHPVVPVDLGEDFSVCGNTVLVAPQGAYSYEWNTGSMEQELFVNASGYYSLVTTGSAYGCEATDTVYVTVFESPQIDLGADHIISIDSSISIGVSAIYTDYMWYNGFNGPILTLSGTSLGVGTHTIWLRVSDENNCTDTDTVYVSVIATPGIASNSSANIKIYPNPATDYLNIEFDPGHETESIQMLDVKSDIVFEEAVVRFGSENMNIDVKSLSAGIYFIRFIFSDGSAINRKIIIN